METLETEHFLLKYDGEQDKLLARYAAPRAGGRSIRNCADGSATRRREKTLVEIFNRRKGTADTSGSAPA